ncbi:MAG: signal recognition particle-docking protein FtsY [Erysipelotrichaceae bacterium]|jgi:fused signal recognition particle receptor|nr:signal recognition particle-docking protein FtsY [Erysipelotrichaceae bacterium]
MSIFSKIKEKLTGRKESLPAFDSTSKAMSKKLKSLRFSYQGPDGDFFEQLMVVLLESDVGYQTSDQIVKALKKKCNEYYRLDFDDVMGLLLEVSSELYGEDPPEYIPQPPLAVILLVGVNGSGKTTTLAKLIHYYQSQGKSVAVAAGDTFRAGAIAQLSIWCDKLGVKCVQGAENQDPASVMVDGCRYAKENQIDVLLCDTAGRLQTKENLMRELSKITRVLGREVEGAPHQVWLVLDATTGQNGLSQAKLFIESAQVNGIILTKMDGSAKGGIVLAIKDQYKIPVRYITLGENPQDLAPFDINTFLSALAGGISDAQEK